MPRVAKELKPLEVGRLSSEGMHAVGGVTGLLLRIKGGSRHWVLRVTIAGKRRHIGLGGYPTVTLAMARELARAEIMKIKSGIDPIAERREQTKRFMTFAEAVEKYLETKLSEFRNEKHQKQWRSTLDNYASPIIGQRPVSDLVLADILRVLEPIWSSKTETASRLRGRIEAVLSWATVAGHREGENPARWKGNLDQMLPKPSKISKVSHHPAVSLQDASDWFADLSKREGMGGRALEFLALTLGRSGEIRGATWDEIDLDAGLWIIPAERMKMEREHRVALSQRAIDLLKSLPRFEGSPYVFPAVRGGALSDATLSAVMRRQGFKDARSGRVAVPHGVRSTFRDWAAERTEFPKDMAEIALAHEVGSEVERAYRRGDMVEKRRSMMAAWARFLSGEQSEKVVRLRR